MRFFWVYTSIVPRLWYLSHRRPAKAQASLRIRAVSQEPSLFAHMKYGSRGSVRSKIRHLAPLVGCACIFEKWIYGGMKVPKSHAIWHTNDDTRAKYKSLANETIWSRVGRGVDIFKRICLSICARDRTYECLMFISNNNCNVSDTFHCQDSHLFIMRRPGCLYFCLVENTRIYVANDRVLLVSFFLTFKKIVMVCYKSVFYCLCKYTKHCIIGPVFPLSFCCFIVLPFFCIFYIRRQKNSNLKQTINKLHLASHSYIYFSSYHRTQQSTFLHPAFGPVTFRLRLLYSPQTFRHRCSHIGSAYFYIISVHET